MKIQISDCTDSPQETPPTIKDSHFPPGSSLWSILSEHGQGLFPPLFFPSFFYQYILLWQSEIPIVICPSQLC